MQTAKAVVVQRVLAEWHAYVVQEDFWPRFIHQKLIDAAEVTMRENTRAERAEARMLAIESFYLALKPKGRRQSVCGRIVDIEEWAKARPAPAEVAEKFSAASKYAMAL